MVNVLKCVIFIGNKFYQYRKEFIDIDNVQKTLQVVYPFYVSLHSQNNIEKIFISHNHYFLLNGNVFLVNAPN